MLGKMLKYKTWVKNKPYSYSKPIMDGDPGFRISRSISKWLKVKKILFVIKRLNLRILDQIS